METNDTPRTRPPRRKKRSKLQIFKEAYLPIIIVLVTFVLLLVLIIGGISRLDREDPSLGNDNTSSSTTEPSGTTEDARALLEAEAAERMAQAAALIPDYDYAGALAVLEQFSGEMSEFPALQALYDEYFACLEGMVKWTGSQVMNLSIHLLIADPQRAYNDTTYGSQYRKNFITTTEFSAMLQQLYDRGFILVSLSDLYELQFDASSGRDVYVAKTLLLPPGKTPIMLTETNANYYTYMTDSNGDGKPDAGADGFAYKLCYGENGFCNELILADGSTVTGAYDMVPILEAFIEEHPSFSYRGARAIIAVSGYDGILGYRINSTRLSEAQREEERTAAATLVNQLREAGYEIACFTYENTSYSQLTATQIQSDLQKWTDNVVPVIGETDIMVFPKESDIAGVESYVGNSKFNVMYNAGFRFFLGSGTISWDQVDDLYVRHSRLMVTGSYLTKYPERYADLFDAATVLDAYRNNF